MNKDKLARNTKDPDVLDELSKHEESWVRYWVAVNRNTKPETLDYLSRDEYYGVRGCVTLNHNTKTETLDVLSRDKSPYVRCLVAENPNCPERAYKYIKGLEILKSLSKVST